jgi:hypothetical protein
VATMTLRVSQKFNFNSESLAGGEKALTDGMSVAWPDTVVPRWAMSMRQWRSSLH